MTGCSRVFRRLLPRTQNWRQAAAAAFFLLAPMTQPTLLIGTSAEKERQRKISLFFCRYQNELPKKIKSRGKDAHLTHEEIVQTIKWKLAVSIDNAVNDCAVLFTSLNPL